ncbi:class II aaRS and biotin synthetase [Pisolithus croceorrhizus]|nr:class II aaRS and biotin synthetase [Pisolithus croceorrhizus]
MDVLIHPTTHPAADTLVRSLTSLLAPHYLPQLISPAHLASPAYPWHSSCALLVLLGPPADHTAVRKYVEIGGRVLALGAGTRQSYGIFGMHDSLHAFAGGGALGLASDTSILRLTEGLTSYYIDFPTQTPSPATVDIDAAQIQVSRIPSANIDVDSTNVKVLARFINDNAPAGVSSQGGRIAVWSCAPSLHEKLIHATFVALGLRLEAPSDEGATVEDPQIFPQLLLAHPRNWKARDTVLQSLFPQQALHSAALGFQHDDGDAPRQLNELSSDIRFSDATDSFHFHPVSELPLIEGSRHPILQLLPQSETSSRKDVRDVILPMQPLTLEQEQLYVPLFSPSIFFSALDEFRAPDHGARRDVPSWRMGDVLMYGEVVTSTQSMLDKNPKFLRALTPPVLSFASKQTTGRGRGANTWVSPEGCILMSLLIRVPLKSTAQHPSPVHSIRASNLIFTQYLLAIAVAEACHVLDPTGRWADKVKLKWPNDIYGEFPAQTGSGKTSELKKVGGILVNLHFEGGVVDIIIGCGLNVLNRPPVASLQQLVEAFGGDGHTSTDLRVERVAAAILASFERIWESFLDEDERGFEPFLDRYTSKWVHSNQIVTLTTTTPHMMARIESITTDYGLLRTVPLSGASGSSQYIDLQPDGNSFDMMKGLIKMKRP